MTGRKRKGDRQIKATGLDIAGADAEKILKDVMDKEL